MTHVTAQLGQNKNTACQLFRLIGGVLATFLLILLSPSCPTRAQQSADVTLSIAVECGGDWKPEHGQGNFHPTHFDFGPFSSDPGTEGMDWCPKKGIIGGYGNGPCCFHIVADVFKMTGGGPPKWIETWIRITVGGNPPEEFHVVNGAGQDKGSMSFWWSLPFYPAGEWEIVVEIGVLRRGYADPPGTYTAKVHMNIANTQNGCPPGHQQGPP